MLNWLRKYWARYVLPALISCFVATFIALAAQTNYLGTVFLADSTVPSRQLTVNSDGSINTGGVSGGVGAFSAVATTTITRPNNTTTYTANTGWNTATSGSSAITITGVCRANDGMVLVPEIDILVDESPATKLQGILWLFSAVPTAINDNATFTLASADNTALTGNVQGFPFTLTSVQGGSPTHSGISLTGTTYHVKCRTGASDLRMLVQVVNAYVPTANEVMTINIHTIGLN